MKVLKVILSILPIIVFQPISLKAIMNDSEFFDSINLDYLGLEQVKAALLAQDTVLAKMRLLEYYQNRTSVQYFELSGSGNTSEANDNLNHYFTVIDIRKYAGEVDGTIDWNIYDQNDAEWHYQFHRMYWLINLGKVHGRTGEEKYAVEWIAELVDWADDNTPGYPRTLDAGIRLRNWVESYQYFIHKYHSSSISSEDHVTVLKSLMEQCRFLRDNWRDEGNWGADETRGLGAMVVMFPEFKFTPTTNWDWWRDLVLYRLQHHLSGDFYPDGVQYETSPSYHSLEYRNLFLNYKLLSMNGISISDTLKDLFVKPLEFMMHIHKPDGYLPQLSDTDRKSYRNHLEEGAEFFNRQDMLYAATLGNRGTPPRNTFAPFPYGGYFVMRSDWGQQQKNYKDTKYLVFDTGSNEPWHAHYDILNFEAYANKYIIIRDAGRYTYVSGTWRDYFKNTTAHNTIVVDNKNQKASTSGTTIYWASLPGFDYVSGKHTAYTGLTHERRIFFVKPEYWVIADLITGNGNHVYDLYFHLDSPYLNHTTLNESDHSVVTPNFIILPSDDSATTEVISGWISNSYNSKQEAPIVKYQKNGSPPITFETVLFPYNSGIKPLVVKKSNIFNSRDLVDPAQAICMAVEYDNKTDWFFHSILSPVYLTFNRFQCDARAALIRIEFDNSISNIQFIQGSLLYKGDTLLADLAGELANVSTFKQAVYVEGKNIQSAKIWSPQTDSVIFNGNPVNFTQNENYVELRATSVHDKGDIAFVIINDFQLDQNYPNPFNNSTSIRIFLQKRNLVNLQIFNISGQLVTTLIDRKMDPGNHIVTWNGKNNEKQNLSSGIYFYRLEIGNITQIKRMLLLR